APGPPPGTPRPHPGGGGRRRGGRSGGGEGARGVSALHRRPPRRRPVQSRGSPPDPLPTRGSGRNPRRRGPGNRGLGRRIARLRGGRRPHAPAGGYAPLLPGPYAPQGVRRSGPRPGGTLRRAGLGLRLVAPPV